MSSISNPASPGSPTQVVAEQPVRSPLAGNIPFNNHQTNPAVAGWPVSQPGWPVSVNDAHVRPVPAAIVDAAGGPMNRAK
jgi:hypothetical protein